MVPYKRVYNYILGRPLSKTLDVVESIVHLKLKYHKVHDEPVRVCIDLFEAKSIYKALQQDKEEGENKSIEINMDSLTKHL